MTEETYKFTWQTYQITDENSKGFCGTYTLTASAAQSDDYCVPGPTTTIALPTGATQTQVFLHATALETTFTLPGIITAFFKDCIFTAGKYCWNRNWVNVHDCCSRNRFIWDCRNCLIDKSHIERISRCLKRDETGWATSETREGKEFLREINKGCSRIRT